MLSLVAARKRDSLASSPSSESQLTYTQFLEQFPSHDACLDYLKERFYPDGSDCPKCGKKTKFHRIKSRAAYSCQYCGHQVYPTAGTIFHKSTTNLQMWFWAIFLMSSTRCGISAKQLEREIGVSYPTAHRMFKQIRTLLSEEDTMPLFGDVEADETFSGGKPRAFDNKGRKDAAIRKYQTKVPIFGMVERQGRARAWVIEDRKKATLHGMIREYVLPESMIFTDEHYPYVGIERYFKGHKRIRHSERIYVRGDIHTNTIEGFFGNLKTGMRGAYKKVSPKYLQSYLDEYAWRHNNRFHGQRSMFHALVREAARQ
jgi:transposase